MASGRAETSLEQEGRTLVERLGGRWTPRGGMCRCPAHDDRTPSLSVRPGRTRLLLHCFAGCDRSAVLRALASARLIDPGPPAAPVPRARDRNGLEGAALRLWGAAGDIAGSPAAAYLAARGVTAGSPELRFHPRTPHGSGPAACFRPAMIAAVRDGSGLVAIHRTFLDPGKPRIARLPAAKCALGTLGSGAVRLGGVARRLGLAEGIETAMSVSILFGLPCWATLGSERFALVRVPPDTAELVLFLDNDVGGRRAERIARSAFAHLPVVEARYPRRAGADWNDVLRARSRGS